MKRSVTELVLDVFVALPCLKQRFHHFLLAVLAGIEQGAVSIQVLLVYVYIRHREQQLDNGQSS